MRQIITKDLASIYTDVPTLRPGTAGAYALAFASAGVAMVLRLAIDPYVMGAECLPFFPAVIITALIGGRDAGLFCVALSTAAVVFLQMPPLTLLLFVVLAIFLVILITRMRLAIQREQAAQSSPGDPLWIPARRKAESALCRTPSSFLGPAPFATSAPRHRLNSSERCSV
jgi:hypothetical protein